MLELLNTKQVLIKFERINKKSSGKLKSRYTVTGFLNNSNYVRKRSQTPDRFGRQSSDKSFYTYYTYAIRKL